MEPPKLSNPNLGLLQTDSRTKLASNYYQISFDPEQKIYTYQIDTNPKLHTDEKMSLDALKVFSKAARPTLKEKLNGIYMECNRTIYSPRSTNGDILCAEKVDYEGSSYEIIIVYKGSISLKLQTDETKQILGRLFKRIIYKKLGLKPIGRKHFDPTTDRQVEGNFQLSMMMGFGTSLNSFGERLLFNIDICYRAIQQQNDVLHYIGGFENHDKDQISQELEGTTVLTRYGGTKHEQNYRFYRVAAVDFTQTPKSTFKCKEEEISYYDYYLKRYNIKIRDLNQPMLKVVQRRGKNEMTLYLIPELCQLTGLNEQLRSNNSVMRAVAKITKPNTEIRMREQNTFVNMIQQQGKEVISDWNLKISRNPVLVKQKILDPGSLVLNDKKKTIPIADPRSNLDRDTQDTPFLFIKVQKWCLIGEQREEQTIRPFYDQLMRSNEEMKYEFAEPLVQFVQDGRQRGQWIEQIQKCVAKAGKDHIQLILLVLSGRKKEGLHYKELKQMTIKEFGIPTQVILVSTIKNVQGGRLRTIANKLLVQMCAKVGGIPWAINNLPFTSQPTMIVGIDLLVDKKKNSSVMGFCATWDRNYCKYYSEAVINGDKEAMCQQIKPCLCKAIDTFAKKNGDRYPRNIIIFRDGLSPSNVGQVKGQEVAQVREALSSIPGCKDTKIIFVCINKSANAKFYKCGSEDMKNMDAPNQGSLVEDEVTLSKQDFYIISQKLNPGQGVPAPTHYYVVENDIGPEIIRDLEILCYKLCFLYYNWTGAIKTPAPLRYASTLSNLAGGYYDPKRPAEFLKPGQSVQHHIQDKIYFI